MGLSPVASGYPPCEARLCNRNSGRGSVLVHSFYVPHLAPGGGHMQLDADEARHAKARRLAVGESIRVVDGQGGYAQAIFAGGDRVETGARQVEPESATALILLQAVIPAERMDWALTKAVEAGVHEIIAYQPAHSALGKRKATRNDRWMRLMREAAKQAGRARFPSIDVAADLSSAITAAHAEIMWLADAEGGRAQFGPAPARVAVIVGPEGGLDADERQQALIAGAVPISFGPWILRSETVAVAALALLQYGYQQNAK